MNEAKPEFDKQYYSRYTRRNIFGRQSGERVYLYNYWKRFFERRVPIGSKILDVGCGIGFCSKHLSTCFSVVGTDSSPVAIEKAKINAPRASFFLADCCNLPFDSKWFSVVIAFDVLEHLENPETLILEIGRLLIPGGLVVMSVPNVCSVGQRLRGDKWYAYLDPTHVSLLSREKWVELFQQAGFQILKSGTDFLWDIPYIRFIPTIVQRLCLLPIHWSLVWLFGFFSWNVGETLFLVAQKPK